MALDSPLEALNEALAGSYRLVSELGRGGMATVFLAEDLKHGRNVALKTLHAEFNALIAPQRFQREIRLAAKLQHPHILAVFDSGEANGRLWFTMPFVDGESLRGRLLRAGPLRLDEATRIASEAGAALQYAHDQGVIHRDIKPDNLLLTRDGITLVADFGIARALYDTLGSPDAVLTATGISMGTPAYMSPEQVCADPALDARTDTYSLGAVVYEMLAGSPPFDGPTPQAMLGRRFAYELVPSVRSANPDIPPFVDMAIQRALAIDPGERFPRIAEFVGALKAPRDIKQHTAGRQISRWRRGKWLGFYAVMVIAVATIVYLRPREKPPSPIPAHERMRIAVVPFENLGAPSEMYFTDGLVQDIRGRMVGVHSLDVIDWNSARQYKNTAKTPQRIGQELGVRYVLTGRIQWDKAADGTPRVRVSPELVDVRTGSVQWQAPFDSPLKDVFAVQADIANRVAESLDIELNSSDSTKLSHRPTAKLDAYEAFLRGEAIFSEGETTPVAMRAASTHYAEAVRIDPAFAEAWARLASLSSFEYANGVPTRALARVAASAAERSVALAPNRPEGYLAASRYQQLVGHNADLAYSNMRRALDLAPRNVEVLRLASQLELARGNVAGARLQAEIIKNLDPRSALSHSTLAYLHLLMHDSRQARQAAQQGRALAPASVGFLLWEAMSHLQEGSLKGAQAVTRSAGNFISQEAVAAYFAYANELFWILDSSQQRIVLTLREDAFDGDRASWALALSSIYALRNETVRSRAYADTALVSIRSQLREAPDDAQLRAQAGVALSYAGRTNAVAEVERAVELAKPHKDPVMQAYFLHQLARVHISEGDTQRALDLVKFLLSQPYYLTPGWLQVDPAFEAIRGTADFQRIQSGR